MKRLLRPFLVLAALAALVFSAGCAGFAEGMAAFSQGMQQASPQSSYGSDDYVHVPRDASAPGIK
jgi:hypothetical protein